MPFRSVGFHTFRNLKDADVDVDAERIFLVGENGQGKTNFLEALYYLCYGSSFRGQVDAYIPQSGASGFGLRAFWREGGGGSPDEKVSVAVKDTVKEIRLNDKVLRDRKDLVFHSPAVVFCHEDFAFAAGDPERKRFFFDQCAGMISLSYIESLRAYKRVLKQRNAALKERAYELLEVLDPQFVRYGLELMGARRKIHSLFEVPFSEFYEEVSELGEKVELDYFSSWPAAAGMDEVLGILAAKQESEILMGISRSGPHRDRWNFSSVGELFTDKASTGQLRLVSLILRVVEARVYADYARSAAAGPTWPIFLLDDVLLELDPNKRRRFLGLLPGKGSGAQAFFTFLPGEPWTEYSGGDTIVYRVSDGGFTDKERL
ncbi:MAG: DNA replication and repair protein RecF [Spirochaetes bacterium]|nr:DNA replication and repair protein RecF [Spirochaetota bacterium]